MADRRKMMSLEVENSSESENAVTNPSIALFTPRQRYRLSSVQRAPPPRTTLAALLLLMGGIVMLSFGLHIFFDINHRDRGLSLIILGSIMFIPGSYASVVIFGTWSGWRGYDYNQIANYDEDDII